MAEDLMAICENWGNLICHPEVKKYLDIEHYEGEPFSMLPDEKEKEELNKICNACDYFKPEGKEEDGGINNKVKNRAPIRITKRECLKCKSPRLIPWINIAPNLPLTSMKVKGFAEKFFYKCDDCGTTCYSIEDLK